MGEIFRECEKKMDSEAAKGSFVDADAAALNYFIRVNLKLIKT